MVKGTNSKVSEKQQSQKTKVIKKAKSSKQQQPISTKSQVTPTEPEEFVFGTTETAVTIPFLREDETLNWQLPDVSDKNELLGVFDSILLMAVSVSGGLEYA